MNAAAAIMEATPDTRHQRQEILQASSKVETGGYETILAVPSIHCGGCVQRIEQMLGEMPQVLQVRVNLSTKRALIRWEGGDAPPFLEKLKAMGHEPHLLAAEDKQHDKTYSRLIRALAISGFASSNIMILSVAVWTGVEPATRDVFHWISAAIALPAILYSGRIFYVSAWNALRHGYTNMDVPISIGIILAFCISLYDTLHSGSHAFFDAAVMLIFFLLIGRVLDYRMREKARMAVKNLSGLIARTVLVQKPDGSQQYSPVEEVEAGMRLVVAMGERIPVDVQVESGISDVDMSLVTGESAPCAVSQGAVLQAGILNLTGPLTVTALAGEKDSFLAEMVRLMEVAESSRSRYRLMADRAAQLYTPLVHLAAFLSFAGWMLVNGDMHHAVSIAVAVLIITCPCAMGLAVPMVQVMAARRLFEQGVMIKDGAAMERLVEVNHIVFDKTGTLTSGIPELRNRDGIDAQHLALAAALAAYSRHPLSQALVKAAGQGGISPHNFTDIVEVPGKGIEATNGQDIYRLGGGLWACGSAEDVETSSPQVVLACNGREAARFHFDDRLRTGMVETLAALRAEGLGMEILSGDNAASVERLALEAGITEFRAAVKPADKIQHLHELQKSGRKVLMVGDGLNDVPALAAAHVSMAPSNASDIGRQQADFVFLRNGLQAVPHTIALARHAHHLIRQNFAFSAVYNLVALPLAVFGYVTPLVAALAMSLSSVVVVANSMRIPRNPMLKMQKGDVK